VVAAEGSEAGVLFAVFSIRVWQSMQGAIVDCSATDYGLSEAQLSHVKDGRFIENNFYVNDLFD